MTVEITVGMDHRSGKPLAWIFPRGSRWGTIRRVESWAEVDRVAEECGTTGRAVQWAPEALAYCDKEWGPPPGAE